MAIKLNIIYLSFVQYQSHTYVYILVKDQQNGKTYTGTPVLCLYL